MYGNLRSINFLKQIADHVFKYFHYYKKNRDVGSKRGFLSTIFAVMKQN